MGSPSELSLDYRPHSYSTALKTFGEQPDQTQKLEDFLARLEEERLKIEAFKRELPLSMQLLNNAMDAYRQQLDMYNTSHTTRPVLEQFIPINHPGTATVAGPEGSPVESNVSSEMASWMTTAQLWNTADAAKQAAAPQAVTDDRAFDVTPKVALDSKQRHGGAFIPFSKERSGRGRGVVAELALAPAEKEKGEQRVENVEVTRSSSCVKGGNQGKAAADGGQAAAQSHRKARRCWTPELHRRFVNALQMLGGSQVATPKQIRELMKVDGLTNDEVKSHLQKYRLHTRRPMHSPHAAASAAAPQLVVLGGIWVPPEYATTAAAGGSVIYGGHSAAAHFCAAAQVQQDFYAPPVQQPPHHPVLPSQHHHDHAEAVATVLASGLYRMKHGSPESEVRGSRERSERIDDREEEVDGDEEVDGEEEEEVVEEEVGDEQEVAQAKEEGKVSHGGDMALSF